MNSRETTLSYILKALIPYSEANLKLAFKPNAFFNDLAKISNKSKTNFRSSYYRAVKKGLVELDDEGTPRLTQKGRRKTKIYNPKLLGSKAKLLLIFDIPESERWKRDRLRTVLRELSFKQIQKSVWECKYDYRELVHAEVEEIGLQKHVFLYEALELD